jgi:hypothetical protein
MILALAPTDLVGDQLGAVRVHAEFSRRIEAAGNAERDADGSRCDGRSAAQRNDSFDQFHAVV